MADEQQRPVFLSTQPAGRRERGVASAVVLVSALLFLAAAPFAKLPLASVPAFIPIYESALVINDLVTAVFLFGQIYISRSRALLLLACGYLFTAALTVAHALTFPGLFSPTGLLGAGPQSTAWLYMFWHGGFPLLVIGYALGRDNTGGYGQQGSGGIILASAAATLAAPAGLAQLATAGHDTLPVIMSVNYTTPACLLVVSIVWALTLLALLFQSRRRP